MKLPKEKLLRAYRQMAMIRSFEMHLHEEIKTGAIAGFTHLYAGQEAIAVGVCEQLTDEDYIVSTHRGHGHCIAKGCDVTGMMKEIYGRADGLCNGKAGSMHIADIEKGMLGANGIVGGGQPIAVGAAISTKLDGKGHISVSFGGDGSCNQGTVFEAMNMAVVLNAPTIFVFENNKYSEHTGVDYAVGSKDIASRCEAFGLYTRKGDGTDFFEVYEIMEDVIAKCRTGVACAVELESPRFYGHFEGDPQRYRAKGEAEANWTDFNCLLNFRKRVTAEGWLTDADLDAVDADVAEAIALAVEAARNAPPPDPSDIMSDVYIDY